MLKFTEINLDHGTPKRERKKLFKKINDFDVSSKGTSILRAASQVDIKFQSCGS